jgi:hypothetical protein
MVDYIPESIKLSLMQRLKLRILGYVYVGEFQDWGFRGVLPFYAVRCRLHGIFLDYPHGYKEYFLCPKCMEAINYA